DPPTTRLRPVRLNDQVLAGDDESGRPACPGPLPQLVKPSSEGDPLGLDPMAVKRAVDRIYATCLPSLWRFTCGGLTSHGPRVTEVGGLVISGRGAAVNGW